MPNSVKPAFYEKVLMDFYENYFPFEAEHSQIGDPFGYEEVESLEKFSKDIQPTLSTSSSVIMRQSIKRRN